MKNKFVHKFMRYASIFYVHSIPKKAGILQSLPSYLLLACSYKVFFFINDVYRFQDMKRMTASKHFSTINNSGLNPTRDSKIRKVYLKIFHGCVEGDVDGKGGGIMVWA